jgi:hypothetical protein
MGHTAHVLIDTYEQNVEVVLIVRHRSFENCIIYSEPVAQFRPSDDEPCPLYEVEERLALQGFTVTSRWTGHGDMRMAFVALPAASPPAAQV